MKRGASKRMMLLIAGVGGAILLLVILGYMLANHREGTKTQNPAKSACPASPPCPACPATAATAATVADIWSLDMFKEDVIKALQFELNNIKKKAVVGCTNLSDIGSTLNYKYNGLTTCDLNNKYHGKGTATFTSKIGDIVSRPITKKDLSNALSRANIHVFGKGG